MIDTKSQDRRAVRVITCLNSNKKGKTNMTTQYTEMTTQEITESIKKALVDRGHTGVSSKERWERDGVIDIWSNETRDKFHITCSGKDNTMFIPGVTIFIIKSQEFNDFAESSWIEIYESID